MNIREKLNEIKREEFLEEAWNNKDYRKFRKFLKNEGYSEKEIKRRFETSMKWTNYENNNRKKTGDYLEAMILSASALIVSVIGGIFPTSTARGYIPQVFEFIFVGLAIISSFSVLYYAIKGLALLKDQEDYETELLLEDSK